MDLANVMPWVTAALAIIALLGHGKTFFGSEGKQASRDIEHLRNEIEEHERRIQRVETELPHLPDRDAQHRVELALAEMNGRFAALEEKLKPIASTSERLHQLLLEQVKK